jgi:hypothetical protein
MFCALAAFHRASMAQDDTPAPDQTISDDAGTDAPPETDLNKADDGPRPLQERCIPLRRVRSVKIIDSTTIIWEVGGGKIGYYKMTLANKCPGLVGRGAFVHSSSGSRLCDVGEWIRVAGGTRAICPIDRIEPWSPPDDRGNSKGGDKDTKTQDSQK